jgi:RecA-family ATPase
MLLAYATGGATDTEMHVKAYTWDGFCSRLMSPRVGNKDGSYYIRGGKLKANKRSDENLLEAELLILDADSTFDPVTGEVSSGAPPLPIMAERLKDMGLRFVAHTSHSARPQDGFWKYRIVFPAFLRSPSELGDCLDYIIAQLHGSGIFLADVVEARRWSQPWFLPRVRSEEDKAHFVAIASDGLPFDVSAALDWAEGRRKAEAQIHAAKTRHANPEPSVGHGEASAFGAFNDAASLDWVRDVLEGAGYRFGYFDRRQQCYRYMRPGSESGTCGVVVFRGSQGHWCTYSHHGSADPLSQKVSDPFELATILRFGGDRRAAARALLPQRPAEPSIVEQIAARQVEGETRPMNSVSPVSGVSQEQPFILQPGGSGASEQKANDFRIEHWAQMQDQEVRWLVRDVIPSGGFVALFGKPGTYKSFVALYLAGCIASGREAFGKETEKTAVVYIAGEGGFGMGRRMRALRELHDIPESAQIYFLRRQINLRSSLEDATKLVDAIRALNVDVGLVVIDTLARAFAGGNENASEDMGAFMAIVAEVQRLLGCAALIVHHSGKDEARGMRGHSSLFGAIDAELEVTRLSQDGAENRVGQMRTSKQKDGEDNLTFMYRLPLVSLSDIDPDLSSLAVEPIDKAAALAMGAKIKARGDDKKTRNRNSEFDEMALKALQLALKQKGQEPMFDQMKDAEKVVHEKDWEACFRTVYDPNGEKQEDSARKALGRAKNRPYLSGQIRTFNEYVWFSVGYEGPDR